MSSTQMAPRPLFSIAATLVSAALIGACTAPTESSHVTPGLAIVSGNGQSGIAGQLLVDPVVVSVGDSSGRAVAGAEIHWEVTSGGGAIAESLSYTDVTGRASAIWTLGVEGLTQTMQAGVSQNPLNSPASMPSVIFTAAANGAATVLLLVAGDNQAAMVVDTLPVPLRVRAVNQAGNGVPGVRVAWAAAHVGNVFPSESLTDVQGEATASWVLGGTVGIQEATATATGLSGSPRSFSATANAAAAQLLGDGERRRERPHLARRADPSQLPMRGGVDGNLGRLPLGRLRGQQPGHDPSFQRLQLGASEQRHNQRVAYRLGKLSERCVRGRRRGATAL
jgi:hypothetical protein